MYNIDLFRKYPFNVQEETFNKIISKSREKEWGKKYGYSKKLTNKDFQTKGIKITIIKIVDITKCHQNQWKKKQKRY